MTTTNTTIDHFDSSDFAPERVTLPWLQVLNNEDPEKSGLFISQQNAETAAIAIPKHWQPFKARFKSGTTDRATGRFLPGVQEGYLFTSARILVVRVGPLSMYTKRTAQAGETYLGIYDRETYLEQRDSLALKTKHLVYLLSSKNELLHDTPMQFTARGVFGATFAQHLREFQTELQTAYGKQRGAKFLINGIFAFETTSEVRGTPPNTAWVTVVANHAKPAKENWRELFVGYNDQLREKLLQDYESFADFGIRKETVDPDTGEILPAAPPAKQGLWEGSAEFQDEIPY